MIVGFTKTLKGEAQFTKVPLKIYQLSDEGKDFCGFTFILPYSGLPQEVVVYKES